MSSHLQPAASLDMDRDHATAALFTRAARSVDPTERSALLEQVVQANLGVIEVVAAQLAAGRLGRVQVQQVAYLALARAVRDHDTGSPAPFLPGCLPKVRSDLQRMVTVRVGRDDEDRAARPDTEADASIEVFVEDGAVRVVGLSVDDVVRRLKRGHHGPTYVAVHEGPRYAYDGAVFQTHDLTERETEVVRRIAAGMSNRDLAASLYLGVNTVKTYIRTAYRKMGVTTRAQAVLWAVRHGLGPDRPLASVSELERHTDEQGLTPS